MDSEVEAKLSVLLNHSNRRPIDEQMDNRAAECRLQKIESDIDMVSRAIVAVGVMVAHDRRSHRCASEQS